jgi:hypothetical protein
MNEFDLVESIHLTKVTVIKTKKKNAGAKLALRSCLDSYLV